MKTSAGLLAVYLCLLALLPCADLYLACPEGEVASHAADHSNPEPPADLCTPFCHCACCSPALELASVAMVAPVAFIPAFRVLNRPADRLLLAPLPGVWRPPAVSA